MTSTLTLIAAGGPGGIGIPFGWSALAEWFLAVAALTLAVLVVGFWLEWRRGLEVTE